MDTRDGVSQPPPPTTQRGAVRRWLWEEMVRGRRRHHHLVLRFLLGPRRRLRIRYTSWMGFCSPSGLRIAELGGEEGAVALRMQCAWL